MDADKTNPMNLFPFPIIIGVYLRLSAANVFLFCY